MSRKRKSDKPKTEEQALEEHAGDELEEHAGDELEEHAGDELEKPVSREDLDHAFAAGERAVRELQASLERAELARAMLGEIATELERDAGGAKPPGNHAAVLRHYAARVLGVSDVLSELAPRDAPPRLAVAPPAYTAAFPQTPAELCRAPGQGGARCERPKGHDHVHRAGWRSWSP
jgi:hypothetical protein